MRVISQDGTIDMPYEICSVWCRGSVIMCDMCGDNTTNTVLATYSTEEKAKKAMEMLRESFKSQYVEYENGIYSSQTVFKFPAEEELE